MIFLPRKHLLEDRAFEYYHQKDFLFYYCQNPVPNQIFSMPFYVPGKTFLAHVEKPHKAQSVIKFQELKAKKVS
jgi:hypothetical protein